MLRTTFDGEEISHRVLWGVVKEQVKEGLERKQGWFNPSVVARVFAYHTVEAYLNYVGERIAPEIWQDERNYFRKEPYRGALGKMRKVMDLVGILWTPDDRPLKTVLELKQIRDLIAHGKPEKLRGEVMHPLDKCAVSFLNPARINSAKGDACIGAAGCRRISCCDTDARATAAEDC